MSPSAAPVFPIARLHLTARADAPLQLPPYAGSMLRGALGHALLALAPLPHRNGQPCALHSTCSYCQVFEPAPLPTHSLQKFNHMPAPYVIEPPSLNPAQGLKTGQQWHFRMVLFGQACAHIPQIMLAWQHALRKGLGERRSPCTLLSAQLEGQAAPFWQAGQPLPSAAPTCPALHPTPNLGDTVTLHFATPLRLQIQGKPAKVSQLNARALLITLARRWQLQQDSYWGQAAPQQNFDQLGQAANAITLDASAMHWMDWGRYSQRQQQEMQLGGLVGSLRLQGELAPFAPLLHLGQWLHLGKNTSFGLGGYRLDSAQHTYL